MQPKKGLIVGDCGEKLPCRPLFYDEWIKIVSEGKPVELHHTGAITKTMRRKYFKNSLNLTPSTSTSASGEGDNN